MAHLLKGGFFENEQLWPELVDELLVRSADGLCPRGSPQDLGEDLGQWHQIAHVAGSWGWHCGLIPVSQHVNAVEDALGNRFLAHRAAAAMLTRLLG